MPPPRVSEDAVPPTERVSPHGRALDADGAPGVLRAMALSDAELLAEHHDADPGLAHPDVVSRVADVAALVANAVGRSAGAERGDAAPLPAAVFVVGCGTSGRLAFLCARAANDALARVGHPGGVAAGPHRPSRGDDDGLHEPPGATPGTPADLAPPGASPSAPPPDPPPPRTRSPPPRDDHPAPPRPLFRAVCAGGDAALFRAAESVEDSADAARKDFAEAVLAAGGDGLREAVVIGVSCGFSARYVATFLDAAMDDARRRFHAVALGFNPIRHASVTAFKDCLRRMRREDLSPIARGARRIVVNPRVGPEAVAGSSRLKGGAATKSILDAAFAAAIAAHARCDPPREPRRRTPRRRTGGSPCPRPRRSRARTRRAL